MKSIFILGCLLISALCSGQADTISTSTTSTESILFSKKDYQDIFHQNFYFGLGSLPASFPLLTAAPIHLSNPFMSGMFCTMQDKLESKSKLSPRFRLGSLNYTEWMEGKKEIYTRYWK